MSYRDFLDVRSTGFCRVAVVIPRVSLADPEKNAEEHEKWLQKAYDDGTQYALCPELGLTGYSCDDLFHNETLLSGALAALRRLVKASGRWHNMLFSVGLPIELDGMVFNCAVTILRGRILAAAPKSYPPEYREFYELRHFARACEAVSKTITLFGRTVLFGNDVLMKSDQRPEFVLHTEVCEDIWVPIPPGTWAALAGATILANLSASNITIGKAEYRESLVVGSSGKNVCVQMYGAAGFGESSSRVSWDGDGYIAERGGLVARTERFVEEGTMIVSDVNLKVLIQDRMRQSSFRQNAADNRKAFRTVRFKETGEPKERLQKFREFRRAIDPHPFVPKDPAKLNERCYEAYNIMQTATERRLLSLPPHMRKIFLALSGGRDSMLQAINAVKTLDKMGLPRANLVCITMPGFGTSDETYAIASRFPALLGATFKEIDIKPLCRQMFEDMGFDPATKNESRAAKAIYENVQALTRKHVLFCEANQKGIALGTGDLSEAFVGWCTFGADQFSYYNPNCDVPKTFATFLIGWTADNVFTSESEAEIRKLLKDTIALDISPELDDLDGKTGKIAQKTEEIIGPYELIEFFGYQLVRFGRSMPTIARMAWHAFAPLKNPLTGQPYAIGDIKHWQREFVRRFFDAQKKRNAAPEGPKIGMVSVDKTGDWRMPSDAEATAWLRELEENVPEQLTSDI